MIVVKPRVHGGPNMDFLKKHGLDENSHPMDWFNAFLPITSKDNLEDPFKANMLKFAVSDWTAYSTMKGRMNNAGEEVHIFAGKYKLFKKEDLSQQRETQQISRRFPEPPPCLVTGGKRTNISVSFTAGQTKQKQNRHT